MARINLKKRGIIKLTRYLIDNSDFETLSSLFSKVIPVWSQYQFHNNTIEYYCISELFDDVEEDAATPEYQVWFKRDSGVSLFTHVERVDVSKTT